MQAALGVRRRFGGLSRNPGSGGNGGAVGGMVKQVSAMKPMELPIGKSAIAIISLALMKGIDKAYEPVIGADGKKVMTIPPGIVPLLVAFLATRDFSKKFIGAGISELLGIFGLVQGIEGLVKHFGDYAPIEDTAKKISELPIFPFKPKVEAPVAVAPPSSTEGFRGVGRNVGRNVGRMGAVATPAASAIRLQTARV